MKKQGIGEAKPYDSLTNHEIKSILDHNVCSSNNPTGLLHRIFMWVCLFGCARGGEHHSLLISQFEDTEDGFILKKYQMKNDQGGIEGKQTSHVIFFPKDPAGINGPNHDIRLYFSKHPSHYKCKSLYLKVTQDVEGNSYIYTLINIDYNIYIYFLLNFPYFIIDINNGIWYKDKKLGDKTINKMLRDICVKAGIDISNRNIGNHSGRTTSIQSIFNAGHEELKAMSISGHVSQPGIRSYLKVTGDQKREILGSVLNGIIDSSSSTSKNRNHNVNDVASDEFSEPDVISIPSEPEDELDVDKLDEDDEPDTVSIHESSIVSRFNIVNEFIIFIMYLILL